MQLAPDPAAKPPSPDRVSETALVVPSPVCSFSSNPEFIFTRSNGTPGRLESGGRSSEHMNKLSAEVRRPVAASGDERLNVRIHWLRLAAVLDNPCWFRRVAVVDASFLLI